MGMVLSNQSISLAFLLIIMEFPSYWEQFQRVLKAGMDQREISLLADVNEAAG
jgi:hypothetical protein